MESIEDDRWSENDDKHEVGYRKPPKHSRFKKGHSGNLRGKPPGTKNSATLLKQALLASVLIKQNGRQTKTTKLWVIVTRLIHQVMKVDYTSIRILFRYAGLDRLLNEPEHKPRGLSPETAQAIRREIAVDLYLPGTREGKEAASRF